MHQHLSSGKWLVPHCHRYNPFGRGGSSRGHGVANEVVSARSISHVLAKGMRRQSSSVPDRHGQCISVRRFAACITEVRHRFAVAEETVAGSCLLKSDVMRRRSSSKSSPVSWPDISSRTTWSQGCSQATGSTTWLRRHYFVSCMTFTQPQTSAEWHCWHCLTLALPSTVLTTIYSYAVFDWRWDRRLGAGLALIIPQCPNSTSILPWTAVCYGRTLSDASMLYFAAVLFRRLSWPNGWTDLHETFARGRY